MISSSVIRCTCDLRSDSKRYDSLLSFEAIVAIHSYLDGDKNGEVDSSEAAKVCSCCFTFWVWMASLCIPFYCVPRNSDLVIIWSTASCNALCELTLYTLLMLGAAERVELTFGLPDFASLAVMAMFVCMHISVFCEITMLVRKTQMDLDCM